MTNHEDAATWIYCNSSWLCHVTSLNGGIYDRNTTYHLFALPQAFPSEKRLSTAHLHTQARTQTLPESQWGTSTVGLNPTENQTISLQWPLDPSHDHLPGQEVAISLAETTVVLVTTKNIKKCTRGACVCTQSWFRMGGNRWQQIEAMSLAAENSSV